MGRIRRNRKPLKTNERVSRHVSGWVMSDGLMYPIVLQWKNPLRISADPAIVDLEVARSIRAGGTNQIKSLHRRDHRHAGLLRLRVIAPQVMPTSRPSAKCSLHSRHTAASLWLLLCVSI
jgi:hypothetical protein